MKTLIASVTLALLTIITPAQEANEESLAAAGKLIETMGIRRELATNFQSAMEPMIQQMGLPPEQAVKMRAIFGEWWEKDIDQEAVIAQFKKLYAETFSIDELAELELFYQTPLGQKVLKSTPAITQKGMQIGMAAAQTKQPELEARMKAFHEGTAKEQAPAEKATEPAQ